MKEKKNQTKARTRNFATVIYPESAPSNWKELLQEQMIPCFISPIHDSDLNPDGEKKKPHYHVLILFDGVKTIDQAKEIINSFGGVGCERVNSIRGYARYLCHLDNPEKAQYKVDDVISLCGANYISVVSLPSDKYIAISDMLEFCKNNEIYAFSDLVDYARENRQDWFVTLCDNGTYIVKEYLKSSSWKLSH